MRPSLLRVLVLITLGLTAAGSRDVPAASRVGAGGPDRIAICSVSDVKGKTSPCGCSTPKGGLARQASYMDSIAAEYGQVIFVDNGGFFPEEDKNRDAGPFLMDAYKRLGVGAVGVADRDLRFGLAFLREHARARSLPLVCANLVERGTGTTAFPPSVMVLRRGTKVGFFGLISDKADLGPSHDSLQVTDPVAAAKAAVADLRRKGAHVVVALSNIGKVPGEELCTGVEGIDVMILGRDVPLIQTGRMIGNTLAVYGGEQGQYMARTLVALDDRHQVTAREAGVYMLGPQLTDAPWMLELVKGFQAAADRKVREARSQGSAETVR